MAKFALRVAPWALAIFAGLPSVYAQQPPKLINTVGDLQEKTDTYGGIADSETKKLDAKAQAIVEKFKRGRRSYDQDPNSRYAKILQMHDADRDGITDHGSGGSGMPGIEGYMDKAAIGTDQIVDNKERAKKLDAAREQDSVNCHKGPDGRWRRKDNEALCNDISAVIVDRGAAHDEGSERKVQFDSNKLEIQGSGKLEEHRVYEMTTQARDASIKAGKEYATESVSDATDYGASESSDVKVVKGQNGNAQKVDVTVNGKTNTVEVAPNVDLLRSEAAYLEQHKAYIIQQTWKTIRANRLAQLSDASDQGIQGRDLEITNLVAANASDADIAKRIAEKSALASTRVCEDGSPVVNGKCGTGPAAKDPIALAKFVKDNANDQTKIDAAYTEANKSLQGDKARLAGIQDNQAKIQNCLQPGKWCDDSYKEVPAGTNVGDAFRDTREYVFNQLEIANSKGLKDFGTEMLNNYDFNAHTDAKTVDKPFTAMTKEYRDAQKKAQEIIAGQQKFQDEMHAQGHTNYQSKFLDKSKFNPDTMSVQKLFGRDPTRDGTTLRGQMQVPTFKRADGGAPTATANAAGPTIR
jgi:hypothetical protein